MIKIRLARFGKKNNPFYRIVATDERKAREGQSIEKLGHWHPQSKLIEINKEGIAAWVKKGAQVTDAVKFLMEGKTKPKKIKAKADEATEKETETVAVVEEKEAPVEEAAA